MEEWEGLGRWFISQEHVFIRQRTWLPFQAPTLFRLCTHLDTRGALTYRHAGKTLTPLKQGKGKVYKNIHVTKYNVAIFKVRQTYSYCLGMTFGSLEEKSLITVQCNLTSVSPYSWMVWHCGKESSSPNPWALRPWLCHIPAVQLRSRSFSPDNSYIYLRRLSWSKAS